MLDFVINMLRLLLLEVKCIMGCLALSLPHMIKWVPHISTDPGIIEQTMY